LLLFVPWVGWSLKMRYLRGKTSHHDELKAPDMALQAEAHRVRVLLFILLPFQPCQGLCFGREVLLRRQRQAAAAVSGGPLLISAGRWARLLRYK
jgi:hypothetical protein